MIEGRGPAPSLAIALVRRLPDDSLTAALVSGNPDAFGYSSQMYLLANIYDAINLNTKATGMWKGKPPDIPLAPRPAAPTQASPAGEDQKPKVRVADLYKRISAGGMKSAG